MMQKNLFEQHPFLSLGGIFLLLLSCALIALEYFAKHVFGLGHPIIYQSHPVYGYRPEPNQAVQRHHGHLVKINNLGLRADQNWALNQPQHKILFLGDSVTYGGSYLSNDQLFSHLAIKNLPSVLSGNAGVNAWGVNNVCAFIQEMNFLPANTYVSVFPEGDFYRGLQRIGGQPFWTVQPRFALEELLHYFIYKIHLKKTPASHILSEAEKTKIAMLAVKNLKALDDYFKKHHRRHIIYITPSRSQVLQQAEKDEILTTLFKTYRLRVIYLKDRIEKLPISKKSELFHDEIHLSQQGHEVWAELISHDLRQMVNIN